jgi:hypothetical protein
MAELTGQARKNIPGKQFGLPGGRRYPMPDRSHAANAKAQATQMLAKSKLSASSAAKTRSKANGILRD